MAGKHILVVEDGKDIAALHACEALASAMAVSIDLDCREDPPAPVNATLLE